MSPLPQEGRTVLEWRKVWRNDWVADFGPFRCAVFESCGTQKWAVGLASGTAAFSATLVKEQFCDSVLAGQLAAESAARDLLCGALAAFAGKPPHSYIAHDPRLGLCVEATELDRDRAVRLALAILKASEEKTP